MKLSIRRRLIAVAMLGGIASLLALVALWPLGNADRLRLARAREAVVHELELVRENPSRPRAPGSRMEGPVELRSGILETGAPLDGVTPPLWKEAPAMLADALAKSETSGSMVILDEHVPYGFLVVGVTPIGPSRVAWAADVMRPPKWGRMPILVSALLGVVTLVLVVLTLHAVASVNRGATSLKQSLSALRDDLAAPVPRPADRELSDVADGIATLARELSVAQRALAERERLAVLGRVSTGIAHELRNPLASIKLEIDLVCRQSGAQPETVAQLRDVAEEIARLDRLVNDLLTIGGGRSGPRQDADLGDLARKRAGRMSAAADERGVRVDVEGSAQASIDPDSIARVIDNLLDNAIAAARRGSSVRVEITNGPSGVRLAVRDRGPGVSVDHVDELFQPFFTTKPEGVGLGLTLSRAIALAHGGSLEHRREENATVFELTLPAKAHNA